MRIRAGLMLALVLALFSGRPVFACSGSAGPVFDPVAESDIVVGGRLTQWEPRGSLETTSRFTTIEVSMDVERTFKGDVGDQLTFVDMASLTGDGDGWAGGSGGCGVFDADPTGQYAILGLTVQPDGSYRSNRLHAFYLGEEPSGERYDQALERIRSTAPDHLPETGRAHHGSVGLSTTAIVLVMAGMLLLTGGITLTRGRSTERERYS